MLREDNDDKLGKEERSAVHLVQEIMEVTVHSAVNMCVASLKVFVSTMAMTVRRPANGGTFKVEGEAKLTSETARGAGFICWMRTSSTHRCR